MNDINLYFQETQQTPKMDKYKEKYSEVYNNETTEMKGKEKHSYMKRQIWHGEPSCWCDPKQIQHVLGSVVMAATS